jgi:uncharacterized membrane protein
MQQIADSTRSARLEPARQCDSFSTRLVIAADRAIYRFAGRWLLWANAVLLIWVAAIVAAPILVALGQAGVAQPIYGFFGLFCHQHDARSFHLSSEKFACCERCTAIHMSIALSGLLFAAIRSPIRPPRYHELVLLVTPVIIDGMAVGAGIYDGNVVMRVVTGSLFGMAIVWAIYPRFETGFASIRLRLETLFDRLSAHGRAKPLT